MNSYGILLRAGAVAALALTSFSMPRANASTMTWNFIQNGWADQAGDSGTLSGSFQAAPEANGTVQLADVSYFASTFTLGLQTFKFIELGNFSFVPGSPNSLDFLAKDAFGDEVCTVSSPAGPCGIVGAPAGGFAGYFGALNPKFTSSTPDFAATTLQTLSGPVPKPAAAPEPGSMVLAGAALVFVGIFRRRVRSVLKSSTVQENV